MRRTEKDILGTKELSEETLYGINTARALENFALGGEVSYAKQLMHGKQSVSVIDRECRIFRGLPEKIPVARYHSLSAVEEKLPDCLKITAKTEDGEIMAVKHKEYAVYGLQFHPESIMTPDGMTILKNFLEVR